MIIFFPFFLAIFFLADLNGLKDLLNEAENKRFPDTELVSSLREAIETAEKCTLVAQQLMSSKVRTRTRLQGEAKCRLTFEELQMFVVQLKQLPCKISESEAVFGKEKSIVQISFICLRFLKLFSCN